MPVGQLQLDREAFDIKLRIVEYAQAELGRKLDVLRLSPVMVEAIARTRLGYRRQSFLLAFFVHDLPADFIERYGIGASSLTLRARTYFGSLS